MGEARHPSTPTATYRLQLHAGFGFDDARELVPYLAQLGVSHLYLSPILQAATGSLHGYDVVDHARVSAALGGREALTHLSEVAHAHDLGIVVDVVPNHMALVAPEHANRALWDVFRLGRVAPTAHWFDVDWEHTGGRFGLPLLGDTVDAELEADTLRLDVLRPQEAAGLGGQPVLRYFDHVFALAPGSVPDTGDSPASADLRLVLERQHYRLSSWREKTQTLAYRRFFDVDSLVAVRVELPDVFDDTHRLLIDLHNAGVVDGFRIDHPDGLADPQRYLERLRDATGGAWVVVEKILEGDELLPQGWACAGSTGYDALRAVQQALVPPTGDELHKIWVEIGGSADLHLVQQRAKREVVQTLLQPELHRLVRVAVQAAADDGEVVDADRTGDALGQLLVQVDVYRAYVRPGHRVDEASGARLAAAHERARTDRPDLAAELALLVRLLLDTETASPAGRDLIVRFQQTCGPVMAKGVEDTTFYRWHELVALNEVGGDPADLHDPSVQPLHAWARRQAAGHPYGMTTLSTHDTKRSEDVRARLLAAAGDPAAWCAAWEPVRAAAGHAGVDAPTAYLLLQTVVGTWPIDHERLERYVIKATREAKRRTTWTDPDVEYEAAVTRLARQVIDDPGLHGPVVALLCATEDAVRATTLGAKILQLTVPGVPDTYQGCEIVNLSLVDPDNRRPVDHDELQRRLTRLDAGARPRDLHDEKLLVTSRALRLRRQRPDLLGPHATYEPLPGCGPHLIAFLRGPQDPAADGAALVTLATRWPTGLASTGGWRDVTVALPSGRWADVLTGAEVDGGVQPVADLLEQLPVALLVRQLAPA